MPFTFLAHQAPIAPLKLARPTWFSGTALAVGSMAPDFEYFLRANPYGPLGHTPLGVLVFCLPVSLVVVALVHRVLAPVVPAHLPDLAPLHLRDFEVLAATRLDGRFWIRVTFSALLGSLTHVVWDGFTHSYGFGVAAFPVLATPIAGVPVYKLLQHGGTLGGSAVTLAVLALIGRRRLLRAWSGAVPSRPRTSPFLLFGPALAGILVGALLAEPAEPFVWLVRACLGATGGCFFGLCLGAALVRSARTTSPGVSAPP